MTDQSKRPLKPSDLLPREDLTHIETVNAPLRGQTNETGQIHAAGDENTGLHFVIAVATVPGQEMTQG